MGGLWLFSRFVSSKVGISSSSAFASFSTGKLFAFFFCFSAPAPAPWSSSRARFSPLPFADWFVFTSSGSKGLFCKRLDQRDRTPGSFRAALSEGPFRFGAISAASLPMPSSRIVSLFLAMRASRVFNRYQTISQSSWRSSGTSFGASYGLVRLLRAVVVNFRSWHKYLGRSERRKHTSSERTVCEFFCAYFAKHVSLFAAPLPCPPFPAPLPPPLPSRSPRCSCSTPPRSSAPRLTTIP